MKSILSRSGVLPPIKRELDTVHPVVSCTDGAFGWNCTIAPALHIRIQYHNGKACKLTCFGVSVWDNCNGLAVKDHLHQSMFWKYVFPNRKV